MILLFRKVLASFILIDFDENFSEITFRAFNFSLQCEWLLLTRELEASWADHHSASAMNRNTPTFLTETSSASSRLWVMIVHQPEVRLNASLFQPITRITTSPSRVYRERSEVRVLTPSAHIYRRDTRSPSRVITSPARICNIRVRPSVLSREFGRIDRKYRSSPFGVNDTEEYLNSAYAQVSSHWFLIVEFHHWLICCRTSTMKHVTSVHHPEDCWKKSTSPCLVLKVCASDAHKACSQHTAGFACLNVSWQPKTNKNIHRDRFDSDLIDRYGNSLIDNEFHVSKNIIRPTRKTRDQIEILSHFKYPESAKRYTGEYHKRANQRTHKRTDNRVLVSMSC